jgi:sugar-specific transcriptional regulator TrmB
MEERITETLRSIGFGKNEVAVYLDLLSNNCTLAKDIVYRTKIHKANVYETLKKLISLGFVKEIIQENKRYFIGQEPKILLDYLDQKQKEIKELIPSIPISSRDIKDNEPEISMSNGVVAARNEIMGLLLENCEILVQSVPKNASDSLGLWFIQDFHKQRIKKKIPFRIIYDDYTPDIVDWLKKLKYTKIRFSELKQSTPVFLGICNDIILTLVLTNPITIIKIKNKDVAVSYRDHFEVNWKISKEM